MDKREKLLRKAQRSLPIEKRGERIRPARKKEKNEMNEIKPGTKVLYYQPGMEEILNSWSAMGPQRGRPRPLVIRDPGTLKEATVTKIERGETSRGTEVFYYTEEGVMLCDSDIREVIS